MWIVRRFLEIDYGTDQRHAVKRKVIDQTPSFFRQVPMAAINGPSHQTVSAAIRIENNSVFLPFGVYGGNFVNICSQIC